MTILLIITLIMTAAFAALTILSRRLSAKLSLILNGGLAVLGAAGIPTLAIIFRALNTSADAAWAADNYAFFLKISLIASGILLFLTVVPTLISAMNVKTSGYSEFLRKAFPVIASSSLLMLSLLAYPFVRHITSNIGAFVYLTGAAESALMRLPYVLTDVKKYRSERFRLKNEK